MKMSHSVDNYCNQFLRLSIEFH